jgi:hypothetical protein
MTGHGEKRTRKQEDAIAALLEAPTVVAAAAQARIGERTLRRWLALPEFKAAYRQVRRELVEGAIGRIQGATAAAVDALIRNLTCGRSGDEVRSAAAILDRAVSGIQLLDLDVRLSDLERKTEEADTLTDEQLLDRLRAHLLAAKASRPIERLTDPKSGADDGPLTPA